MSSGDSRASAATGGSESLLSRVIAVFRLHPPIATARVLSVTTGLLYLTGGVLVLLTVPSPAVAGAHLVPIALLGLLGVVTGIATLRVGRRLPHWMYHVLVGLGTAIITALVCFSGGGMDGLGYGCLYTFVAIDCFFFFAWPVAVLHLVAFQTCSFVALSSVQTPLPQIAIQQGCTAVVALVVGWLVRAAAAAELDSLTNLTNRRGLDRLLDDAFRLPLQPDAPLSLVLLDLDHFKAINEAHGHTYGDRVLRIVAHTWSRMLRPGQVIARLGGDEFALLLPRCPGDRAVALVDAMREVVAGYVTCSAGVALRQAGDSRSMLVNRADVALYEAKAGGRNRTARREDDARACSAAVLAALAAAEFELYYQPIVELESRTLVGHEALVRWNHPERGLVLPAEFIPAAEESGAIHALGAWILEQACAHSAALSRTTGRPHRMSVNAAGIELRRPGYADAVAAAVTGAGLDPANLVLEVTESTLDGDHPEVLATLHRLRRFGVRIAIDDFGTGYSSLHRLHNLPVDILKIDRSFVATIGDSQPDSQPDARLDPPPILTAIVSLADAMALQTVAEGIETRRQAEVLRGLGCEFGQGYFFGRPQPAGHDTALPPGDDAPDRPHRRRPVGSPRLGPHRTSHAEPADETLAPRPHYDVFDG